MASRTQSIYQSLTSTLLSFATAKAVKCVYCGETYAPIIGTDYLIEFFLPSTPENITIGKDQVQRIRGVYQVDVYSSKESALSDIYTTAADLNAYFKTGYPVTYGGVSVQIENFAESSIITIDGWNKKTISIFFRCEI